MPQLIPFVVQAIVASIPAVAAYASAAAFVASVAVGAYQSRKARRAVRAAEAAAAEAARMRGISVRSATAPRQLVLGEARISGPLCHAEYVGTNEEYFDVVVACGHGELYEVVGYYAGDEYIAAASLSGNAVVTGKYAPTQVLSAIQAVAVSGTTFNLPNAPRSAADVFVTYDAGGDAGSVQLAVSSVVGTLVTLVTSYTGSVTVDYKYVSTRPVLQLQSRLGTTTQTALSWSGVSTPKWTANHRLLGVSHLRALMLIDDPVYQSGPPDFSLRARGPKTVYDPRISGNLSWTSNPALLAAWYRTLPRADGGMGIPTSWIDWPSVAAAANICDELITVKTRDGSGYEQVKRYECHTVLSLDVPALQNLRIILSAMDGDFPFTAGLYRCYAGAFRAAAITLTDADVDMGSTISFAPAASSFDEPPNVMTGVIFDAVQRYTEMPPPAVSNSAYITADGEERSDEIELLATTDPRQANYLMGVALERQRPSFAGSLTVKGVGADIALLDTVQLNLTNYTHLVGKTFEVRRRVNQWNGCYPLELREVKASTWALDAEKYTPINPVTPPDNTDLWQVAIVAGLNMVSGTNELLRQDDGTVITRGRVTWTLHSQQYVREGGRIELRYRRAGQTTWIMVPPVMGSDVEHVRATALAQSAPSGVLG
jgi:hypothetical protein